MIIPKPRDRQLRDEIKDRDKQWIEGVERELSNYIGWAGGWWDWQGLKEKMLNG